VEVSAIAFSCFLPYAHQLLSNLSWPVLGDLEFVRIPSHSVHQENHFYPGTNMFVSFFPGFHKASQDVLGQPELS
jgi:hypothetical protein